MRAVHLDPNHADGNRTSKFGRGNRDEMGRYGEDRFGGDDASLKRSRFADAWVKRSSSSWKDGESSSVGRSGGGDSSDGRSGVEWGGTTARNSVKFGSVGRSGASERSGMHMTDGGVLLRSVLGWMMIIAYSIDHTCGDWKRRW